MYSFYFKREYGLFNKLKNILRDWFIEGGGEVDEMDRDCIK